MKNVYNLQHAQEKLGHAQYRRALIWPQRMLGPWQMRLVASTVHISPNAWAPADGHRSSAAKKCRMWRDMMSEDFPDVFLHACLPQTHQHVPAMMSYLSPNGSEWVCVRCIWCRSTSWKHIVGNKLQRNPSADAQCQPCWLNKCVSTRHHVWYHCDRTHGTLNMLHSTHRKYLLQNCICFRKMISIEHRLQRPDQLSQVFLLLYG